MTPLRIVVCLALLLPACRADAAPQTQPPAPASVVDPAFAAIDAKIESYLTRTGTPGAALVVVRDGRIVHARGDGFADVQARRTADANTVWPIASITKVLTAISAMQLVEAGKLSLQGDVASRSARICLPVQTGVAGWRSSVIRRAASPR